MPVTSDLVTMKAVIWDGEQLGATYDEAISLLTLLTKRRNTAKSLSKWQLSKMTRWSLP